MYCHPFGLLGDPEVVQEVRGVIDWWQVPEQDRNLLRQLQPRAGVDDGLPVHLFEGDGMSVTVYKDFHIRMLLEPPLSRLNIGRVGFFGQPLRSEYVVPLEGLAYVSENEPQRYRREQKEESDDPVNKENRA